MLGGSHPPETISCHSHHIAINNHFLTCAFIIAETNGDYDFVMNRKRTHEKTTNLSKRAAKRTSHSAVAVSRMSAAPPTSSTSASQRRRTTGKSSRDATCWMTCEPHCGRVTGREDGSLPDRHVAVRQRQAAMP